jgi:hypothetical protein
MLPHQLEMREMKANSQKMENEKGKLVLFSSFFDSRLIEEVSLRISEFLK